MIQGLISKLVAVLENTLAKLSRYDEGSLIGSILSLTVSDLDLRSIGGAVVKHLTVTPKDPSLNPGKGHDMTLVGISTKMRIIT